MEQFKNAGSSSTGENPIFTLANALSQRGLGQIVLAVVGLYLWQITALAAFDSTQPLHRHLPLGVLAGAVPLGYAAFGRWRSTRGRRTSARAGWSTVLLLGGVILGLGVIALLLIRRKPSGSPTPQLSVQEIDRLASAEAGS